MRMIMLWCLLILLAASISAQEAPPTPTYVLLISLDGTRPDAIQQMDTPNIDALAARGSYTWQASTIFPSATIPAHASMLTGLDVSEHGISHNNYSTEKVEAPTFITTAYEAGYAAAMVSGKNKLDQFQQHDEIPFVFALSGDGSVVDAAIDLLNDDYTVLFVQFPNPDYFGHLIGWMSDAYLYELENTDIQVGRLLAWYEDHDVLDETLIVLTADHGGHDQEHGQDIPEDMLIPWIIAGPGVREDHEIEAQVSVADTAHTILYALGLDLPESELGQVVTEVFEQAEIEPTATPER